MAINKLDFTDLQDSQKGTFQFPVEMDSYVDGDTIALAAGTVEYLGEFPYRVESGDQTITDSGVAVGAVYVLMLDTAATGVALAYVSTKAGTWDPNKKGYYVNDATADDGAKVVFRMVKAGSTPIYSKRIRTRNDEVSKARDGQDELNDNITIKALIF